MERAKIYLDKPDSVQIKIVTIKKFKGVGTVIEYHDGTFGCRAYRNGSGFDGIKTGKKAIAALRKLHCPRGSS